MQRCIHIFLGVFAAFVFTATAFAKKIDVKWGSILGAEKYEYELNRDQAFTGEKVRAGSTKNLYFVTDLGPGVYFLRVRGVDEQGKPGAWSQGVRYVVEADQVEVLRPANLETVETASEQTPFWVEWTAVDGAEDYQVQFSKGDFQRNLISTTNSMRIDGLKAGQWNVTVLARVNGQVIQKSKVSSFRLVFNPKPKPVIYSPVSGETTIAWDYFTIRWLNNSEAPKSEVVIRRMGVGQSGVVSREIVVGRAQTLAPKLPPGSYQISVTNIYDNMASQSAVVEFVTKEDAMGFHAKYFGVTGHFVLGPTFGYTGFNNPSYGDEARKFSNASGEFDFRLTGDVYNQWGVELGAHARGDRFFDTIENPVTDGFVNIKSTRIQSNVYLGARYRMNPFGPSKPLWLRAWLFWRQVEMPSGQKGVQNGFITSSNPGFTISNSRAIGTGLGAEMRWGGMRSRWDVVGRLDLLVPWISMSSSFGTGGVSPLWPTVEMRVIPRVTMSPEMRLGLVLGGRLESISFTSDSGKKSSLSSLRAFFMPMLSWDL